MLWHCNNNAAYFTLQREITLHYYECVCLQTHYFLIWDNRLAHVDTKLNFTSENMLCENKSVFENQLNPAMTHAKQCAVETLKTTSNALDLA